MADEDLKPLTNSAANAMSEIMAQTPEVPPQESAKEGEQPPASASPEKVTESPPQPSQEESPKEVAESGTKEKETPPAEQPPASKIEDSEAYKNYQAELDQIKLRSDAAPKTSEQFSTVKAKAAETFKRALALEQELAAERQAKTDYEAKLKETQEQFSPDKLERLKQLEEHYQNFGIIDDPQFSKPYDDKIQQHDQAAINLLTAKILPQGSAKYIMDNGGPSRFRYSNDAMPANFKNEDGSQMTHKDYWERYIDGSKGLDKSDREELDDIFRDIRAVTRDKNQKIADVQKNRATYVQESKAQQEAQNKQWHAAIESHAAKYAESLGDIAKIKETPAGASADVQAEIKRHNDRIQSAKQHLESIAPRVANDPHVFIETLMDAARARAMDDLQKETSGKLEAVTKARDELQKELDTIKAASSTASKGLKPTLKPQGPPRGATTEQIMTGMMQEAGELKR